MRSSMFEATSGTERTVVLGILGHRKRRRSIDFLYSERCLAVAIVRNVCAVRCRRRLLHRAADCAPCGTLTLFVRLCLLNQIRSNTVSRWHGIAFAPKRNRDTRKGEENPIFLTSDAPSCRALFSWRGQSHLQSVLFVVWLLSCGAHKPRRTRSCPRYTRGIIV